MLAGYLLGHSASVILGRYNNLLSYWVWVIPTLWALRVFGISPTQLNFMFCTGGKSEGLTGLLVTGPWCCAAFYSVACWRASRHRVLPERP